MKIFKNMKQQEVLKLYNDTKEQLNKIKDKPNQRQTIIFLNTVLDNIMFFTNNLTKDY